MLILSNVLAMALIAADEPKPTTAPAVVTVSEFKVEFIANGPNPSKAPITVTGELNGTVQAEVVWNLSLADAIRIGLENSDVIRVISTGVRPVPVGGFKPTPISKTDEGELPGPGGIVIAPVNRDASVWNFKAAIMAHVRSIEQQYWALSLQQVTLWSRETAVKLGIEILDRERADLTAGRSNAGNVAEAEQQLENFKLSLITATSDLITTERQLRNILGLPAADHRRIAAATAPTEALVSPIWEASLAEMIASQPDLAHQRQLVGSAELKAIIEGNDVNLPADRREASQRDLETQRGFLKQILNQTTHSLARFFLEVDTNYKQFQTARNLKTAALNRLQAQRAFYDEGRVTIDRLLDAVSQYANAITQEALYKCTYNTALAALEEAKGTLLAHDKITVADRVAPKLARTPQGESVVTASFDSPVAPAKPQPAPTTYKLRAKFGGVKFLEVEVEVNTTPVH